jgi:hypothetical protein
MPWMVVAVNDDGRTETVLRNLHGDEAAKIAGKMRDQMTDKQVDEGWNYLPRRDQFRTKAERASYKLWRTLQSPMPKAKAT